MTSDDLLKRILESQQRQEELLSQILESTENSNEKYQEYLKGQIKSSEEYRKELEKTSEDNVRNEATRMKEHESYMRSNKFNRITNYFRIVASCTIATLLTYFAIYGMKTI